MAVLGLTLAGFGLASPARAVSVPFLAFVAALGILVQAAAEGGLGRLVEQPAPPVGVDAAVTAGG